MLARLATDAIELLATGTLAKCADCTMVFVRTHARRRRCHPTCALLPTTPETPVITWRRVTTTDFPLLGRWLAQPHVKRW